MRLEVLREQMELEESDKRAEFEEQNNQALLLKVELQDARDRIEQLESTLSSEGTYVIVPLLSTPVLPEFDLFEKLSRAFALFLYVIFTHNYEVLFSGWIYS